MAELPPPRVIMDMRESGMYIKYDRAVNPVKILNLIACGGWGRETPTSPYCLCPYVVVYKANWKGVVGVEVPICLYEDCFTADRKEDGSEFNRGRLYKLRGPLSEIAAQLHANISAKLNGIVPPIIDLTEDDEEELEESSQVLEPVLEQSNPVSVETSAAGDTVNGNNMQNMSPPGVNPAASNQQINMEANGQLECETPQVGNGQRNEMPGCSKTMNGNDEATEQVPLEQVTPINNMSERQPSGSMAPPSAAHGATTSNKKLPLRTSPRIKARQQKQAGKGNKPNKVKGTAGRDKSFPRLLGVIKCENIGRRTPTSRCYCVGRAIYKTNEEGNRVYAGAAMPLCMLKQCYGIKDGVGEIGNSCASTVVVNPEEFEEDNSTGNGEAVTSTYDGQGSTFHGFLIDPPVFKEPTGLDLKNGLPLVPLEGFEGRNVVKRPAETSRKDDERVQHVPSKQPRLTVTQADVQVVDNSTQAVVQAVDNSTQTEFQTIGNSTQTNGTTTPENGTRNSDDGNISGSYSTFGSRLNNKMPPPVARRKELVVRMDANAVKEEWFEQLCTFPWIEKEKAAAISSTYPDPKELFHIYRMCSIKTGRELLANIQYTVQGDVFPRKEKVGYLASDIIYGLFTAGPPSEVIPEVEEVQRRMGRLCEESDDWILEERNFLRDFQYSTE